MLSDWLCDLAIEQRENGAIPCAIPNCLSDDLSGSALSDDAVVTVPWALYKAYGNVRMLEKHYPCIKKWIEFISSRVRDGLWPVDYQYGDWLALDARANSCIGVTAVSYTHLDVYKRQRQDALQGVANGLHGGQIFWTRKPVRLNATVGVSVRAKEAVCGDSYAVVPLPDDRMMAVICDGMGTGEAARAQSERAVRLITRWMQAGADAPSAIGAANAFFLWQGSETFSTLDLAVIDLRASRAELYKLAAPRCV